MFYRLHSDGLAQPVDLSGVFAGPTRTACWIIGGGPSLADLPTEAIRNSPLPRFGINLAGHQLLRPTFWTSYDPTARFQRSIYLDASILKFVHRCRAMDLVPETTFKVCEAPATFFFDRDPQRGFHDFPAASGRAETVREVAASQRPTKSTATGDAIVDWQDSLVQAIDLAYHLGFRKLLLAGCDMFVPPSPEQLALAQSAGVEYQPRETLRDFFERCRQAGLSHTEFERLPAGRQYHFDERKPLAAAVQTDLHYFRVSQYLRLARRAMGLAGLELVSVTPDSRLNDYFAYRPAADMLAEIAREVGDPTREVARGRYTGDVAGPSVDLGPMRDFPPHNWSRRGGEASPAPKAPPAADDVVRLPVVAAHPEQGRERLRRVIAELPEIEVPLDEAGAG